MIKMIPIFIGMIATLFMLIITKSFIIQITWLNSLLNTIAFLDDVESSHATILPPHKIISQINEIQ